MRYLAPILLAALMLPVSLRAADPVDCQDRDYDGKRYTICAADLAEADMRLFLYDDSGAVHGQFNAIDEALSLEGKRLLFAMNAGMYHRDRSPVGHYVENGEVFMHVVPGAGPGNFGMVPNGVFCIRQGRADVIETKEFLRRSPPCQFATQSGPMLVIDGKLHPRFLEDSDSRYIRNGVGTTRDGRYAIFAISADTVTFHEFARLFRDALDIDNALYLDGNISRLHAPMLSRSDVGFALGPVVGVVGDPP